MGTFTRDAGTVVNLVAEAEEGYYFVKWTGDVDTIADVNAATTTITMNGDYTITANFAPYTPMVAAGDRHTVGLKSDGRVVAVGSNQYAQCNVDEWVNIKQVVAGAYHTVGLKYTGTLIARGTNQDGQLGVGSWDNIMRVAAGYFHTVAVDFDGRAVAVGLNDDGQCDVATWTLS